MSKYALEKSGPNSEANSAVSLGVGAYMNHGGTEMSNTYGKHDFDSSPSYRSTTRIANHAADAEAVVGANMKDSELGSATTAATPAPEQQNERGEWGHQLDFLMSCIGFAVGLGNVWRFPYLAYMNGGGAFLVPYLLFMFFCGIPLFFLETSVGQNTRNAGVTVWRIVPIAKGIGFASIVLCSLMNIYVNVIVSWAIFYFIAIFQSVLPWSTCGNEWNTDDCVTTDMNISDRTNDSVASVEEYWERRVLKISTGIGDVNEFRWELFFTMAIAWLLVYAMLWRGLHNSGKLIWITALFPYVVMTILLIKAVTLPGAGTGIMYYLVPEWERLKDAQVWIAAGSQIFFSYGIGTGSLFALGSYNNYNSNCYRDTIIVGFINSGTSIYAGFCTFAILGFMAQSQGKEVGDVITSGPGLVFIVYPEVVSQLPMPQLWAALYLIMFALIGLDSQYCTVQGVITAIMDMFPNQLLPRRKLLVFCTCVFYMLVATPMLTDGGMYLFQLFDAFSASGISLIFIVFCETIAIAWIYGAERVYDGINDMIGFYPMRWWKFCWQFVCPIAMIAIFVFNFVAYEKFLYAGWYEYPPWGYAIAWLLSCMSMVWIPVYAVYYVISQAYGAPTEKTSFSAKLRHVVDKGSTAKIGFGEDDRTSSMANMELDASGISRGDSDDQLVDKELAPVSFVVNSNPAFNEKF